MAEVIGTLAAVNQLIEKALRYIVRFRKAYERFKELKQLFEDLEENVSSIRKIIEIIKEEAVLQTDDVTSTLIKLEETELKLVKWLRNADPGERGPIRKFKHQLIHGSKDREALSEIMKEQDRVKADLCLKMHVAQVGLTQTVENKVIANSEVVKRIDRRLRRTIGTGVGLKIAELLGDRLSQHAGSVQLSDADVASLASKDSTSTENSEFAASSVVGRTVPISPATIRTKPSGTTAARSSARSSPTRPTRERIVLENTTEKYAMMINAPIGDDLWRDIDRVEIKGNKAAEASTMINYTITRDNLDHLMDRQKQRKRGDFK